ncbi:MAG: B-box zinc finger protein [Pyrinomonadaceae bacterium]|nr:B-box zinc finger protein [Pyrinomonadaceae bacterium]
MNCAYHTTNRAVIRCNTCARPLCPACDHRIRGFPFCQDCIVAGAELLQQQHARASTNSALPGRKTSPFFALLLSFLVPGLGAAYNGQTSKAFVHFAIFAGFFQMATITDGLLLFVLGILGTYLFAAVDAFRSAQLIRAGFAPETESELITQRLYGNPLAWAVMLVALGTIFLLHTLFGIRLPVRELLPVALILLGGYTIYDYVRGRAARRQQSAAPFDSNRPPPSVITTGGNTGEFNPATFRSGDLVTQISARSGAAAAKPFEPLR